jgi:hypothetical protein
MKEGLTVVFGLFCLAIGVPGLWSGLRHGKVRFKSRTYWRNQDARGFWESEFSNGVAALVGIFFVATGLLQLLR